MKKFLFQSFSFLAIAILFATAIFVYLNIISVTPSVAIPPPASPVNTTETETETATVTPRETLLPSIIPPEGFPLRMLPLSDTQKSVLTASGIDIDTFMITPAMIECGEVKIGKERMFAISEGDALSVIEVTKLLPCLME